MGKVLSFNVVQVTDSSIFRDTKVMTSIAKEARRNLCSQRSQSGENIHSVVNTVRTNIED